MSNPWRYIDSLHLMVISPDGCKSGLVDGDEILSYLAAGGIIDQELHVASPEELRELAAERLRLREQFHAAIARANVEGAMARNPVLTAVEPAGRA
jgi:hypothetical protein